MTTPFADAAISYAEQGMSVFRISPGKKTGGSRWVYGPSTEVATADATEIALRARRYPASNIGIATGALADGTPFVVLDVDTDAGGIRPDWAIPTREASTPSGGFHCYYVSDGIVKSSVGRIAPGVDVQAHGKMVVAPPSTTEKGVYSWTTAPDAPMAFLPAWQFHEYGTSTAGSGTAHTTRCKQPEDIRRGEVHDQCLAWAAWFANQGCDDDEVRSLVWEFVSNITIPVDNANGHIDSAIEWVLRKRNEEEEALALTITPGGNS